MSILMDFYAVNAAYPVEDYRAHADFSLHLDPIDAIDDLLTAAADLIGEPLGVLLDYLTPLATNTMPVEAPADLEDFDWDDFEPEAEVHQVSSRLVEMLAGLSEQQGEILAARWFKRLHLPDAGDEPTPAIRQAVRDLINVCQVATQEGIDVVYTWSL